MVALSFADPKPPACDAAAASALAPTVWVPHDGKPGMASQALGLAEATGFAFIEKPLRVRRPWAWLPPQLWIAPLRGAEAEIGNLRPPSPDLVIGCRRNAGTPAPDVR